MADGMGGAEHLFTPEQIEQHAKAKANIGSTVKATINSEGWKMFLALFRTKALEIRAKDDYPTLEDFKADRRGLQWVKELLEEFNGFIEDGEAAVQTLKQLHEAERRTPTPLSFDIGMSDETRDEG